MTRSFFVPDSCDGTYTGAVTCIPNHGPNETNNVNLDVAGPGNGALLVGQFSFTVRYRLGTIRASTMASQKTLPSDESAAAFIAAVPNEARREDAQKLCGLLAEWTGEPPVMWGKSIVGFGHFRYRYDSGHEGTAALVGFSPRKANLVLYLVGGVEDRYPKLLQRLGPHRVGKGCLYLNRLDDVDHEVLRTLVERTVRVHRGADRRASA